MIQMMDFDMLKSVKEEAYCVIDVRGEQSFKMAHLPKSINLKSNKIINFLESSSINKPILIVCFSGKRAKDIATQIHEATNEKHKIYYLNMGIMEAHDVGIKLETLDSAIPFQTISSNQTIKSSKNLSLSHKAQNTILDIREKFLSTKKAFIITFSGGKDSTCVLQLFYDMLVSLPENLRRPTFAIASNTLVEAPHIDKFLKSVIQSINLHALKNNIPFKVIEVAPSTKDEFWINLIGKGYPSPTRTFRWCTDRLKIKPAKNTVAKIVNEYGSAILCLGTRKAESTSRKKSMEKRLLNDSGYSLHNDFPNTMVYSPIAEWSTDDVWAYLLSNKPKWDKDHSELFSLYAKASGEECQFITDLHQSSCGGSRFGCWVCTLVNEDKSMQGFIDTGEEQLRPLNNFRNYIKDLREDKNARSDYKRDGRAVYKIGQMGPFLSSSRIEILHKLLEAEKEYKSNGGENLISDIQILEIQKQWDKDFDFNNTAIKLAKEYNRMENFKESKRHEVLHKEIIEEIAQSEENIKLGITAEKIEDLIVKSVEISNTYGERGKDSIVKNMTEEVEKLVKDMTAKLKEKGE